MIGNKSPFAGKVSFGTLAKSNAGRWEDVIWVATYRIHHWRRSSISWSEIDPYGVVWREIRLVLQMLVRWGAQAMFRCHGGKLTCFQFLFRISFEKLVDLWILCEIRIHRMCKTMNNFLPAMYVVLVDFYRSPKFNSEMGESHERLGLCRCTPSGEQVKN